MADINDFKIINNKSKKYFEFLNLSKNIREKEKERLGFYLFIIECITKINDIDQIKDSIIDTEFCSIVLNEKNNDEGIDAVIIDDEKHEINLFNFKFREKFNISKGQTEKNVLDSSKFLNSILNEESKLLTKKTKNFVEEIIKLLKSKDTWSINLYLVSNEVNGLAENNNTIKQFQNHYDLNIHSITLNEIANFISNKPDSIEAEIFIDQNSVITYEEDSLTSSKSYVVKLSLLDLIRITCTDKSLRKQYNLEDMCKLKDVNLELTILYDNVRGYLGENKFNKNILKTLEKEPSKFFMFNNGITIVAKDLIVSKKNANTKLLAQIIGFQIVNGGQTLRTIYKFKNNNFDEEKLLSAYVLVRIFKTVNDYELTNNIAEYTNSQTSISSSDLKSINNIQIQIEKFLKHHDILYVRKSGDIGDNTKEYKYRISKELMAQIIYSKNGNPDKATNQKKRLFEDYYEAIFIKNFEIGLLPKYVKEYEEIKQFFAKNNIKGYVQKFLYVMYLNEKEYNIEINAKIVEYALKEYRKDEDLSEARKLIQKNFKIKLDEIYEEKAYSVS